jgi:hypothetical protein
MTAYEERKARIPIVGTSHNQYFAMDVYVRGALFDQDQAHDNESRGMMGLTDRPRQPKMRLLTCIRTTEARGSVLALQMYVLSLATPSLMGEPVVGLFNLSKGQFFP